MTFRQQRDLAADVRYALGDYEGAAQLAANATARMSDTELKNPIDGTVRLAQVAAEAGGQNRPFSATGYTRPKRTLDVGQPMKAILLASLGACAPILLSALAWSAVHSKSESSTAASIDGTYELTERVMASGAVLRSPSIAGLYTQAAGHFNLNIFVKKDDGTIASESTVGRFTFSADKYCEWIIYTLRKDLDKPGVTNEAPPIGDHCALVTSKDGRFNFSPPGEGVEVSYGSEGFTASIGGDFVDHWTKIR